MLGSGKQEAKGGLTGASPSSPTQTSSEEELMTAYVAGNQEAFQVLFHRLSPLLTSIARRKMGSDDGVRDVVQQTFLHLHRARHDFQEGASLRPWLVTIELNVIKERRRSFARRPLEYGEVEQAVDSEESRSAAAQTLEVALKFLSDEQREVIRLHWVEGLTFPELAKKLGKSSGSLRVSAHRALGLMRKHLDEEDICNVLAPRGIQVEQ